MAKQLFFFRFYTHGLVKNTIAKKYYHSEKKTIWIINTHTQKETQ